ncbi:MAG: dihydrofolate reductase family protein [Fidelibacterota bacterium]
MRYLEARRYDYIITGEHYVDYRDAIRQLAEKFSIYKILVDTGKGLGNILLNNDLIDEISLILSPEILGKQSELLFAGVERKINLRCTHCELLKSGYVWLTYEIVKNSAEISSR